MPSLSRAHGLEKGRFHSIPITLWGRRFTFFNFSCECTMIPAVLRRGILLMKARGHNSILSLPSAAFQTLCVSLTAAPSLSPLGKMTLYSTAAVWQNMASVPLLPEQDMPLFLPLLVNTRPFYCCLLHCREPTAQHRRRDNTITGGKGGGGGRRRPRRKTKDGNVMQFPSHPVIFVMEPVSKE